MMFRIETWICTTLFAAGIIAGMTYLNLSGYTSTGAAIDSTETANLDSGSVPGAGSEEKLAPSEAIYQQLAQQTGDSTGVANIDSQIFSKGDMYLVAGNYALALENYYDYEQIVVKSGSSILLRQAFCCEMQKRYRRAEEKYYLALTQENSTASHQLMGHAGLARCLAKEGKRSEAIDMLAEQILKLDQLEGVPEEIRSQIVYQFAKVLESYAMGDQTDLTLPNTVVFEDTQPQTEFFLDAIDQPEVSITAAVPADFQFKILQRPSNSLNVISVSISATWEPIEMLLGQIASQADQTLVMSSKAQAAIANRARTVQLQSSPLSSLLDQILIPFDLVWYQVDSELHIIAHDEVPPEVAPRQFWIDASLRAYRRFELAFDSGHRRQASMLSRGNLSFIQNNLDAAANHYQELAQTQPHAEILAKLFFNQAKLSMLLDRTEDANQSLYLAVDQTLIPTLQASGFCLLGKNMLSLGELSRSIKLSRRGLAAAVTDSQRLMATLNLARAYLLDKNPFMANKILFDNREYCDTPMGRPIASILGTYARYIGVRDDNGIRIARNRLLSAVTMVPASAHQSFVDSYMAGLAYERLGFRERAIGMLLLAVTSTDVGSWKRQILFELGVLHRRLRNYEDSTSTFKLVISEQDDSWNRLALQQLAEVYLESDQPEKCIEVCRRMWELKLEDEPKRAVLQMLGDAHEKKGEHYSAALFFAGMVPDKF